LENEVGHKYRIQRVLRRSVRHKPMRSGVAVRNRVGFHAFPLFLGLHLRVQVLREADEQCHAEITELDIMERQLELCWKLGDGVKKAA